VNSTAGTGIIAAVFGLLLLLLMIGVFGLGTIRTKENDLGA
jgi:hypothetical protein